MEDNPINDNQEQSNDESQGQLESSYDKVKMGGGATNFKPWLFKKGQSGNPGGMKKGTKSMKVWAREYLAALPDDKKEEFADGLPKDILWRMAEGQPHQSTDMELKGNVIVEFHESFKKKNARSPQTSTKSDRVEFPIQSDKSGEEIG